LTVGVAVPGLALAVFRGQEWSWRGAVLLLVILPVSALAAAWRLDDPALGRHDRDRIRRLVDARLGVERAVHPDDHSLTTFAQLKIVATSHSALAALSAAVAFGVFTWVLPMPVNSFFRDRWGMFEGSSQLLYSGCCLAAAIGVLWFAGRAEVAYRWSPRHLLRIGSNAALLGAVALAAAVTVPLFGLALVGLVVSFIAFGAMFVVAALTLMVLSEPERRPYAAVLIASAVAAGDVLGTATFNTIGDRFGVIWGLLAVTVFPLSAAGRLSQAVTSVDEDVTSTVNRMVESHDLAVRVSLGQHLPLLSCRNLDFAYTDVQVLFDVSLTVDDGEMVALLGTNGAGKSTLLRLISGLELPRAGSLHYRGADITYLGTDRRVQMGISQIPGGRAVFGSLTVVDNLRAYGHSLGLGRSQLDAALDRAFEALPRLGERRNQLASTLSGGEQQMVALGKAYLLKPRLLLIDELSLGLAPKIVGELLEMVRQINADGTAVVLVEQSVNIALGIVDHAYFMEKGAIRFDGAAADLLARPDLLRSVFLQGAAKGLSMAAAR
jgi:ABC-type branched-subunit amino acid transport system ATPase component